MYYNVLHIDCTMHSPGQLLKSYLRISWRIKLTIILQWHYRVSPNLLHHHSCFAHLKIKTDLWSAALFIRLSAVSLLIVILLLSSDGNQSPCYHDRNSLARSSFSTSIRNKAWNQFCLPSSWVADTTRHHLFACNATQKTKTCSFLLERNCSNYCCYQMV